MSEYMLEVRDLKKYFKLSSGFLGKAPQYVYAVDGISFSMKQGQTLGIVGESGCGKSTLARMLLQVYQPTQGQILFEGTDLSTLKGAALKAHRKNIQMIFQDPYSSLNPKMRVVDAIAEPLWANGLMTRREAKDEALRLLQVVGLREQDANKFPYEFSGGQRQRVGIARAIALKPKLILADEAVSALDVSVQAQILNLMMDLKEEYGLSYLFISHNLAVIEHICDEIAVMYLGHIMEKTSKECIWKNPLHPYTKALFSAAPVMDRNKQSEAVVLQGDVPNPADPPSGCVFHTRCPNCTGRCREERPQLREAEPGHWVACHFA